MTADWQPKIHEAIERLRDRYDLIGRKTAAPFLAVIYPAEDERAFLKEWHSLAETQLRESAVVHLDLLASTSRALQDLGLDAVVDAIAAPMPGSNPEQELGAMWTRAVADEVQAAAAAHVGRRPVVVLEGMAALHPATPPGAVMHALWDGGRGAPDCVVVLLIPGELVERRVYRFLGSVEEFMYSGDIL